MIRKVVTLFLFAVAISSSLGAGESPIECDSPDSIVTGVSNVPSITGSHQEPDDCGACHHENSHPCHFGHCHSVIEASINSLEKPDFVSLSHGIHDTVSKIYLLTYDRPPQA